MTETTHTYQQLEEMRTTWLAEHSHTKHDLRAVADLLGKNVSDEYLYPHNTKPAYRWTSDTLTITRNPDYGSRFLPRIGEYESRVRIVVHLHPSGHVVANFALTNDTHYDHSNDFIVPGKWLDSLAPTIAKAIAKQAALEAVTQDDAAAELAKKLLIGIDV